MSSSPSPPIIPRPSRSRNTGNDRMRGSTAAIQQGARAFLRRQYRSSAIIAVILAIVFAGAIFGSAVAAGKSNAVELGLKTAGAFPLGSAFSALAGFIGMQVAIRTNVRSAAGSLKSFNDALVIALRGGAVSGLSIVGLSLAGVSILYYGYGALTPASSQNDLVLSIVGFGFGASLVALFAQLGGGVYTKAVDVGADLVRMVTAFLYVWITQYYTEASHRLVIDIAKASETVPATNIIASFSVGLEATWLPIIVVSGALLISYCLGQTTGIAGEGLYGTAIATMGMLSTAAYILAMDTFGPIVDNGAGIIEMSGMSQEARRNMDKLDAAGNTTKALTKGYAVGSAALAAFLLFNAYLEETGIAKFGVNIAHPETFIGGFIGAALVFLFTAYAIRAVGRAAWAIIKDVRDQFRENPGIMAGTAKPDYARW